jgi:hypothetical protein
MIDVRTDHEPISPDGRFRSIHDGHNLDRGPTITVVATNKPTFSLLIGPRPDPSRRYHCSGPSPIESRLAIITVGRNALKWEYLGGGAILLLMWI